MAGLGAVLTFITFAGFASSSQWWTLEAYPQTVFLGLIEATFAFTTVSLFSLYMKISWTGAAATQFTLFMTLSNLGTAIGPFLTRFGLGDQASYLLCAGLALVPIPFLVLLKPETVVRRRDMELQAEAT